MLDLRRLEELQEKLGRGVPEIAAVLVSELTQAIAGIQAGLSTGDLSAAALAAHAARNSALMLDAQPMLDALREIEAATRAQDAVRAQAGLAQLRTVWPPLQARLEAEARGAG